MQSRDAYGIVLIPQGFERDLLSGRPSPIAVYGDASYFLVYQKVLSGMAIPVRQMGATIAASCSFLTPIGHQNNTLVMGPGGYAFGDYWRVGLPLEIIVLMVGVPMLLFVWPL